MSGQPTVIYHAASPQQAHILKGVLEARGIPAWVVNDNIQVAGGELPLGWTAAACVVVGEFHAADARQIAQEFDHTTAHEPTIEALSEPEVAEWQEWPVCPQCQAKRSVRCPICHSSGTEFALAAIEERGGQTQVLLICPSCDDHFRPELFRLCPQCGHDYGDGLSVGSAADGDQGSVRLWVVMGVMGAIAAAVGAYFYVLWR
jgi:Zn finger protein HypA/HybF involved in hydrogenase expression